MMIIQLFKKIDWGKIPTMEIKPTMRLTDDG